MGIFTTIKKDIFPDNEIDVENYDDENEETVVKNVAVSQNKAANKMIEKGGWYRASQVGINNIEQFFC